MAKYILHHRRALGDIVTLTALARDLSLAGHIVSAATTCQDVWRHNPHVNETHQKPNEGWIKVNCEYGSQIRKAKTSKLHFIKGWYEDFANKTGVVIQPSRSKPDLHLRDYELEAIDALNLPKRYWVIISGGKWDFTTKHPVTEYVQQVSDVLVASGIPTVQMGALPKAKKFWQPVLKGTVNLLGKTDIRQMMAVIARADGVLCTITSAMHIAAAFDRPCVVWAGGREEPWWESYTNDWGAFGPHAEPVKVEHKYLHTAGMLPCCPYDRPGCWKSKTISESANDTFCKMPVHLESQSVPRCQTLITPDKVLASVFSYYVSGQLPPVEGAMIPAVDKPISLILPDGKPATIQVSLPVIDLKEDTLPMYKAMEAGPVVSTPGARKKVPPRGTVQNLNHRPFPQTVRPRAFQRPPVASPMAHPASPSSPFDHPAVGGKFTMFILMYGDYFDMHKKCLDGVINSQHFDRLDLRILGNAVGTQTRTYILENLNQGKIRTFYDNQDNRKKYPVMREAFRDKDLPITTKWVLWFDDDTLVENTSVDWLGSLAGVMVDKAASNLGMIGRPLYYVNSPAQMEFIKGASWYRGRPFRDRNGTPVPNGRMTHFVGGYLWAMKTECIVRCDIPDLRLGHNGGDVLIGEQIYQNGYTIAGWNKNREFVNYSAVPRRGLSEPHYGKT